MIKTGKNICEKMFVTWYNELRFSGTLLGPVPVSARFFSWRSYGNKCSLSYEAFEILSKRITMLSDLSMKKGLLHRLDKIPLMRHIQALKPIPVLHMWFERKKDP